MIQVGDQFGFWRVLDTKKIDRKILCLCQKCSTEKMVDYVNLKRGTTTNCGCFSKRSRIQVGDIYGSWEVVESIGEDWRKVSCRCTKCSAIKDLDYLGLNKKSSCSCEKKKREIEIGKIFGDWKVLSVSSSRLVECICLGCNNIKKVSYVALLNQTSKSCGCKKLDNAKETNLEKFGVEYNCLSEQSIKKRKNTCLERYGVESPFSSDVVREKMDQANLKKYGVTRIVKLPENRSKLKDWCVLNPTKLYVSKPEMEILNFIKEYYPSACKLKRGGYELDIFIPEINVGIEYNGLYRHSELFKDRSYHLNKTKYFKEQGIRVLHVWGHEWIKRKEQIKSFILSAVGKNSNKIGARKCEFVWSSSEDEIKKAQDLLEAFHIRGKASNPKYVVNVYYLGELIGSSTFSLHHRKGKEWVLTRFVTKKDYTIVGGLMKISKLASKMIGEDIISWAEYRLSEGTGYKKAGWTEEALLPPDYFYFKGDDVFSKQSRQKKVVKTPDSMTEREHAKMDGLLRVYDCGKIRFKMKKEEKINPPLS